MKLRIFGSVHEFNRFAKFDNTNEDLPSLVGKKTPLACPDTFINIQKIEESQIVLFFYHRLEGYDEITLNSWEGNEAANAFYEKMGMGVQQTTMEVIL